MIVIGLDEMRVLGESRREVCDALRKGTAFILLSVPLVEVDFGQELIHGLRLAGKVAFIQMPGIPLQEHAAEVEDDGFDRGFHAGDSIRFQVS